MEEKIKKLKAQLNSSKIQFSKYKTYSMTRIQKLEQEKLNMIRKQIGELKILNKRIIKAEKKMKDLKHTEISIEKIKKENTSLQAKITSLQAENNTLSLLVNDMLANKCGTKIITCPICRRKNRHTYVDEIYGLEQKCCVCMDKPVKLFLPSCKHACLCMGCYTHMTISIPEEELASVSDPIPNYMNLVDDEDLESQYLENYPMEDVSSNDDHDYFSDF